MRRETSLWFLFASAAAVAPVIYGQNTPAPAPGAEVHGYVSAVFPTAAGDQEIALPGVRVFLRQAVDDQIIAASAVVTNARGYFRTPLQPPGRYRVCGEAANFEPGCAAKDIEMGNQTVLLNPHLILKPVGKAVYGRVTLADGSPAARSSTSLYTTGGAARVAMVNAQGQTVAGRCKPTCQVTT